ncbi:MAG: glycosyltransferase, partial [Actinomycetota bacterium]|nr:glycosyltransferase [Actinomycetota bacterium]
VLHPTAHDEPAFHLPMFDLLFTLPSGFGFLTEEEEALVNRRFGVRRPSTITGIGVDLELVGEAGRFRRRFEVGDEPYLLYLGRIDPAKGADELIEYFNAYKQRSPGPLKLVLAGEAVRPARGHPDVVVTGFLDEAAKRGALAGSLALVHPSYFESFSIVLVEAWAQRRPAIVQRRCEVLAGQAARSGGAIPYSGFAEFEAAVDLLRADPRLAERLGEAGRRYVEQRYDWSRVLREYERLLVGVAARGTRPRLPMAR